MWIKIGWDLVGIDVGDTWKGQCGMRWDVIRWMGWDWMDGIGWDWMWRIAAEWDVEGRG